MAKRTVLIDRQEFPCVVSGGRRYIQDPWLPDSVSPYRIWSHRCACASPVWALSTKHWRQRGYHKERK